MSNLNWEPRTDYSTSGDWGHACVYAPNIYGKVHWCVWDEQRRARGVGAAPPTDEGWAPTADDGKATVEAVVAGIIARREGAALDAREGES